MSHYFEDTSGLKSKPQIFRYSFGGREYTFVSDAGVFSAGRMDSGTAVLLQNIPPLTPGGTLLDLGCGNGCIGIILAKEYSLRLTQMDINPRAAELACENCKLNGVESRVLLAPQTFGSGFDTITLNPPIHAGKQAVFALYQQAADYLNPGGSLYVVIRKKHGAESSVKFLAGILGCRVIYRRKGIFVLGCEKNRTFPGGKLEKFCILDAQPVP